MLCALPSAFYRAILLFCCTLVPEHESRRFGSLPQRLLHHPRTTTKRVPVISLQLRPLFYIPSEYKHSIRI